MKIAVPPFRRQTRRRNSGCFRQCCRVGGIRVASHGPKQRVLQRFFVESPARHSGMFKRSHFRPCPQLTATLKNVSPLNIANRPALVGFGNHDHLVFEGGEMEKLDEFLQITEAAEFLGVCCNTLRNWGRMGKIPEYRHPVNNYRLYKVHDLESLLESTEESLEKTRSHKRTGTRQRSGHD